MNGAASRTDYVELILKIRGGDNGAMRELIAQFQDVAAGTAYCWVKDPDLAKDVAQEAFLDAYLNLHQLREPKAFPAWFRQVVIKHCDRITRRRSAEATTLAAISEEDPEAHAASEQEAYQLRMAIAALPTAQRQVIALQYFAELTGPEIADFLQLPLSTVKKRLHLARRSLRDQSENLMKATLQAMRPSNSSQFSDAIQFFIAMREDDLATVRHMLEKRPELANTQQDWDSRIVYQRVLPFASKATALITAVELDSLPLAKILLDAGADPNGLCGCATAEPPLWAATLLNRIAHVDLLLSYGAHPNAYSAAGNTPLHVAAMRDYGAISQRLLAAGADPTLLDDSRVPDMPLVTRSRLPKPRRTPGQWAASIREREPALSMRVIEGVRGDMLETGIKAVDFFSPLPLGGLVRINFAAGVGMLLLISELIWRFSQMQDTHVVWTGFTQPPFDRRQFDAEMAEFGIAQRITPSIADCTESADRRRAAFADGLEQVAEQARAGKHVFTIILATEGFENDVDASLPRLKAPTGNGSVTTLVVTPFRRDAPPAVLSAPFDVEITLDRRRALNRLYPSIDPAHTFSNAAFCSEQHELRARVDRSFALHDASDPLLEAHALNHFFEFFSQPFKVAEPFGGVAAQRITAEQTLQSVEALLNSR